MPRRILYYLNIVKAECRDKSRNKVFQDLTLPRRILYYLNITKAERRDFSKNKVFQDLAMPRRILYYPNTVEARAETFQKRMFPYLTLSGRTYTYTFFKYRKYPPQSQTPVSPHGHIHRVDSPFRTHCTPCRIQKRRPQRRPSLLTATPAGANRPPRRRNTYPPSGHRSRGAPSSWGGPYRGRERQIRSRAAPRASPAHPRA